MTFLPVTPLLLVLMAPSQGNAALQQVFMFGMIFVIFYFFMIMPQQKTRKQHEQRVNELKRGDEIVTVGGLVGEVVHIKETIQDGTPVKTMEDRITIKTAESRVIIERRSIARVLTATTPVAGS